MKQVAEREGQNTRPRNVEEFRNFFGPPPWEIANSIFEEMGLGFTVNHPDLLDDAPFTAR